MIKYFLMGFLCFYVLPVSAQTVDVIIGGGREKNLPSTFVLPDKRVGAQISDDIVIFNNDAPKKKDNQNDSFDNIFDNPFLDRSKYKRWKVIEKEMD